MPSCRKQNYVSTGGYIGMEISLKICPNRRIYVTDRAKLCKAMKKNLLFNLLIICSLEFSEAANYYLSSTLGKDTYSAQQAGSLMTPWKTLDHLNEMMGYLKPGDSVLFKRGETFQGLLVLTVSGSSTSHIVFGSYGSGNDPVITDVMAKGSWNELGGNLWSTDLKPDEVTSDAFFLNGKAQPKGRFPNATGVNKGYLTVESHSGTTALTNPVISESDWIGGECVLRIRRWKLDRRTIDSQSGNTLHLNYPASYEITDRFGFFIQGHQNTLDQNGEWYFDSADNRLVVYALTNPGLQHAGIPVTASLFTASEQHYFTLENLEFRGSLHAVISLSHCSGFEIKNSVIRYGSNQGIEITGSDQFRIQDNTITDICNNGMIISSSADFEITGNLLRNVGLWPGRQTGSGPQCNAVYLQGQGFVCNSNVLDSIGYIGIFFEGSNIQISRNYIRHFCLTLDDGAAIYTSSNVDGTDTNRLVEENMILYGIGAPEGTDDGNYRSANGIYADDRSENLTIRGNTVAYCGEMGVFLHNASHCTISDNVLYNNLTQLALIHSSINPDHPIHGLSVSDNTFVAQTATQLTAEYRTNADDLSLFGSFTNNAYYRPADEGPTLGIYYYRNGIQFSRRADLSVWQSLSGQDLNARYSPVTFPVFNVTDTTAANRISNGAFNTDASGWNIWSAYGNAFRSREVENTINGPCLRFGFGSLTGKDDSFLSLITETGAVETDKQYLVAFSAKSSAQDKLLAIALRNGDSPYDDIAAVQHVHIGSVQKEFELMYQPANMVSASTMNLEMYEDQAQILIDNVKFKPASFEVSATADSIVLFTNPTPNTWQVTDGKYYLDFTGKSYHNFQLAAFRSIILIRGPFEFPQTGTGLPKEEHMMLYPDPAGSYLHVRTGYKNGGHVRITNMFGQTVYTAPYIASEFTLDISSLVAGLYQISVSQNLGICVERFIHY
jgi:parallel beta-helix repeat protein